MGIWVRSQNKGVLVNANYFFMDACNRVCGDIAGNSDPNVCAFFLGEYDSEEEALAVLDMIQKAIQKIAKHPDYAPVFQMPEAGFSGGEFYDRP